MADRIENGVLVASGPGVHSDEASSALPDLRGKLPRATLEKLARVADQGPLGGARRANPSRRDEEEEEEDDEDPVMPQARLFLSMYLVTGMWGPDAAENRVVIDASGVRRSLPLVRENPRRAEGFFERMALLKDEIARQERFARKRYREKKKAPGGWVRAFAKMGKAVAYVLKQKNVAAPSLFGGQRHPFGMNPKTWVKQGWGVIAAKGNQKLPFAAYSELPMPTCPGAGKCGVAYNYWDRVEAFPAKHAEWKASGAPKSEEPHPPTRGFCYSFRALRYPGAFSRLFMNTLADYADREFAIIAGGGRHLAPSDYAGRVRAAIVGMDRGARQWQAYVADKVLRVTYKTRTGLARKSKKNKPIAEKRRTAFFRLFVDGDISYEDNILAWMDVVRAMGPGGTALGQGEAYVETYAYSKAWSQLLNADKLIAHRGGWPVNYTVNMSSGSIYEGAPFDKVRAAMEALPITRGYFIAIPLKDYIPQLEAQTRLMRDDPRAGIEDAKTRISQALARGEKLPFEFSAERIRDFLRINSIRSLADLRIVMPDVVPPLRGNGTPEPLSEEQIRHLAYDRYIRSLFSQPGFARLVMREVALDEGPEHEAHYLAKSEEAKQALLARAFAPPAPKQKAKKGAKKRKKTLDEELAELYSQKALTDKALALVLHETLWTFGLGGSCPLVCGNCQSNPGDMAISVHRCASKVTFKDKAIHIGIH